jgi:hypothetical protein
MGIHDHTVQEAVNIMAGQGGAIVIDDTNPHYGDYSEVYALEASEFTAALADSLYGNGIGFNAGSGTVAVGCSFVGGTTGAVIAVNEITVTGGSFAGGDAAGWMKVHVLNEILPDVAETFYPIDHTGAQILTGVTPIGEFVIDSAANGGAIDGGTFGSVSLVAGQSIKGAFYKIQLASGKVLAYKK